MYFSPMRASFPTHLIHDLMTLMFGGRYKPRGSSLCSFFPPQSISLFSLRGNGIKYVTVTDKYSVRNCGLTVHRDSSVGVATRYGLDGLGVESRSVRDFPHPSRPALEPTQPPIQWVKRPGRGVYHLPHIAPRLKKV